MKIKRKLYPNSNDKEFILMSINDLVDFALKVEEVTYGAVEEKAKSAITEMLLDFEIKTPASHLKKTKKQKTEENVNA
jgi:hypothetical protein